MAESQPGGPFYERRWFHGTAAVVALVGAVVAVVGPLRGAISDLFSSSPPRIETEVVFDGGAAMNAKYRSSGETKLDFARRDLARYVVPFTNEGLALRVFGGTCGQKGSLVVGFGAGHGDDVTKAVDRLRQGQGSSDLFTAVGAAVDDFTCVPSDTVKRVIVYVGAIDNCASTTNPALDNAREIRDFMKGKGIRASFKFFDVGLSHHDRAELHSFESALPSVQVVGPPSGASGPQGAG